MALKITAIFDDNVDYDALMQTLIELGAESINDETIDDTPDPHAGQRQPKPKKTYDPTLDPELGPFPNRVENE